MNTHSHPVIEKSFLQLSFEEAYANVRQVAYQKEWRHGSYMNGACQYKLDPGVVVCSKADAPDNRRMLLIGTRAGTVVVFERFTPRYDEEFVLVSNAPAALRFIIPSGRIEEGTFVNVINPYKPTENMGSRLETACFAQPSSDMMVG